MQVRRKARLWVLLLGFIGCVCWAVWTWNSPPYAFLRGASHTEAYISSTTSFIGVPGVPPKILIYRFNSPVNQVSARAVSELGPPSKRTTGVPQAFEWESADELIRIEEGNWHTMEDHSDFYFKPDGRTTVFHVRYRQRSLLDRILQALGL